MITYAVTDGDSSIDVCSQLLARRLGVREFHTDIFQQVAEHFGAPLFSFTTDKALWEELCFVVALNRIVGPLHLSNHHLGRYGVFLRSLFIVTVHDLMRYLDLTTNVEGDEPLIHRPNLRDRAYLKFDYLGIRRAVHLIAISRHTKTSLVKHLGVPEEKTSVVTTVSITTSTGRCAAPARCIIRTSSTWVRSSHAKTLGPCSGPFPGSSRIGGLAG